MWLFERERFVLFILSEIEAILKKCDFASKKNTSVRAVEIINFMTESYWIRLNDFRDRCNEIGFFLNPFFV